MVYVREGIPNKMLKGQTQSNIIENICLELNLKSRKWFLCAIYNPHGENAEFFLRSLSVILDSYQKNDNLILIGDFNLEPSNSKLQDVSINFSLNNLVQINTCFKNVSNPRCIDLILTNKKNHFQNTTAIETGISDFHKLVLTVLKAKYIKAKPKTIMYRDYKKFHRELFRNDLYVSLCQSVQKHFTYASFQEAYIDTLDKYAPCKLKYIKVNEANFMNKTLKKAVMTRSKLKNKYLKNNSEDNKKAYKSYRNYCVKLFKTEKKMYYEKLNTKLITDNKKFWCTVKPSFSDGKK